MAASKAANTTMLAAPPPWLRAPPTTTVPLKRTQGTHDLFIVFKNATAKPDDVLMTLTAIRFVLDEPGGGHSGPQ